MKKMGFFLLTTILLIISVGEISCQSRTVSATPEGTIRLYLDAYCKLDSGEAVKFFVKEDQENARRQLGQVFTNIQAISLENLTIEVISKTENTAKVRIKCNITSVSYFEHDGKKLQTPPQTSKDQIWNFDLEKRQGEWLVKAPPVQPNPVPPAASTPNQTPTPTPEKVLFATDMGLTFWPLDPEGKKFIAYGLGFYGTPPGNPLYYDFPLVISRSVGGGPIQTVATITDPSVEKIGDTWNSNLITDADYNVVFKVKLTRVAEGYKYKVEFFVSPNYGVSPTGERQWLPPATYPSN